LDLRKQQNQAADPSLQQVQREIGLSQPPTRVSLYPSGRAAEPLDESRGLGSPNRRINCSTSKEQRTMHVSHETPAETQARLHKVIAQAELVLYPGAYAFTETPAEEFPAHLASTALAFVRDEDVWSALVPCSESSPAQERMVLFSFHFPPELDNSGFVGWLASHLKATVGTGVLVVCGHNSSRGGVFDYWGAPVSVGEAVVKEVQRLCGRQIDA
jgi:hypothetical protein